MKKIKFVAILTDMEAGMNPNWKLESLGLRIVTDISKKELNLIQSAFMEKKQLQITIKDE